MKKYKYKQFSSFRIYLILCFVVFVLFSIPTYRYVAEGIECDKISASYELRKIEAKEHIGEMKKEIKKLNEEIELNRLPGK